MWQKLAGARSCCQRLERPWAEGAAGIAGRPGGTGPAVWSAAVPTPSLTPRSLPLPAEIRTQLAEQFKCLEQQSESRLQLLQDLQEFFRRKAEIELEYSRSLEKLAERFSSKIRSSREHQFK